MSYRLQLDEPLAEGVPRVVCEQLDRALAELNDPGTDTAEAVHQVRKRCKKIRGVLRLVRGSLSASYRQENVWFRDLARRLSGPRDAQAMLESFDQLREAFSADLEPGAFAGVRKALAERRTEVHEGGAMAERVADTVEALRAARVRVPGWRLDDAGFAALEQGLSRTYRRARKAQRVAYAQPTPEHFHEWRKRVKYHWYHLRLLRELWPAPVKALALQARRLADLLGDDHDLAVLQETLRRDPEALGDPGQLDTLAGLAQRRQDQFRAEAWSLGWRLFADKPRHFCQRLHHYWQAAQRDAVRAAGLPGARC
jgi:CHAD domain-containing protein